MSPVLFHHQESFHFALGQEGLKRLKTVRSFPFKCRFGLFKAAIFNELMMVTPMERHRCQMGEIYMNMNSG